MGNTWEVYAFRRISVENTIGFKDVEMYGGAWYGWEQVYAGECRRSAMRAARKEKDAGCGCVRIEWR